MVKIERKKGLKKIRITHNKTLFWIIILLLIILIFLIYFIVRSLNAKTIDLSKCKSDSDCIKVQTGCCSCNMGGAEKCVLNSMQTSYQDKLNNCSKNQMCLAVYSCTIKSCSCVNGVCDSK